MVSYCFCRDGIRSLFLSSDGMKKFYCLRKDPRRTAWSVVVVVVAVVAADDVVVGGSGGGSGIGSGGGSGGGSA